MTQNDEIRSYLDHMLEHERACALENCPACQSAQKVYETVRGLIFSGVAYPQVAITARRGATEAGKPAGSARKASAKRAA